MTKPKYNTPEAVDAFVAWVRDLYPDANEAGDFEELMIFLATDIALALHRNGSDVRDTIDRAVITARKNDFEHVPRIAGIYEEEPEE